MQFNIRRSGSYEFLSGEEGDVIEMTLTYYKDLPKRGIWFYVGPVKLEKRDGFGTTKSMMVFDNRALRMFVRQLPRKSDKELVAIVNRLTPHLPQMVDIFNQSGAEVVCEFVRSQVGGPVVA